MAEMKIGGKYKCIKGNPILCINNGGRKSQPEVGEILEVISLIHLYGDENEDKLGWVVRGVDHIAYTIGWNWQNYLEEVGEE